MFDKLTGEKNVSVAQLKTGKIWTNWVWRTKNGKQTKRPLSKVNDPTTWVTYSRASGSNSWSIFIHFLWS